MSPTAKELGNPKGSSVHVFFPPETLSGLGYEDYTEGDIIVNNATGAWQIVVPLPNSPGAEIVLTIDENADVFQER